jgi:hypothetical protein
MKRILLFSAGLFCLTLTNAQSSVTQSSVADFNQGSFGTKYIVFKDDVNGSIDGIAGQVSLKPTVYDDFAAAPAGWTGTAYTTGTATYSGGLAVLDGYELTSNTSITNSATKQASMEWVATYSATDYINAGLFSSAGSGAPWVTIGRGTGAGAVGNQLYARYSPNNINPPTEVSLPGATVDGNPHRYQIVWKTNGGFDFYVDGIQQAIAFTPTIAVGTALFPSFSDYGSTGGNPDLNTLSVDWVKAISLGFTLPTGAEFYTSKVFGVSQITSTWGNISWHTVAILPNPTSITMFVNAGDTPTPDGTWSGWLGAGNGEDLNALIGTTTKYIQYRFRLTTSQSGIGPAVQDVTITSLDAQLPVTFTNVKASAVGSTVKLDWATISESNNKGFEVMRSTDGVKWGNIGFVPGAINSSVKLSYNYTDKGLTPGDYYYRLRQVDLDGKVAVTNVARVRVSQGLDFKLYQNYPNPLTNNTMISYDVAASTRVKITVYDQNGKLVKVVEDAERKPGNYNVNFDASRVGKGMYYYKIEAGNFVTTRKMIKE